MLGDVCFQFQSYMRFMKCTWQPTRYANREIYIGIEKGITKTVEWGIFVRHADHWCHYSNRHLNEIESGAAKTDHALSINQWTSGLRWFLSHSVGSPTKMDDVNLFIRKAAILSTIPWRARVAKKGPKFKRNKIKRMKKVKKREWDRAKKMRFPWMKMGK